MNLNSFFLFPLSSILSTKPIEIIIDNIADPPYDTKGNGMPTTGIKPETIEIFIIT